MATPPPRYKRFSTPESPSDVNGGNTECYDILFQAAALEKTNSPDAAETDIETAVPFTVVLEKYLPFTQTPSPPTFPLPFPPLSSQKFVHRNKKSQQKSQKYYTVGAKGI